MNRNPLRMILALACVSSASAQMDIPGNPMVGPKKYTTRSVGGGVDPGAKIDRETTENPSVRYVTHIVLFEGRWWTSSEGKPLEAKLIAFEDMITETPKGAAAPSVTNPPAHPTVTKNGKVRLLVNKKPVEIALDRLSQQDQEFIEQIKAALDKKAASGK